MWKRLRILLVVALVAVGGGLAWLVFHNSPPDPIYNGKPLSDWLRAYSRSFLFRDGKTKLAADDALRHLGTNAVPFLYDILLSLGAIGPGAKDAVPLLMTEELTTDEKIRIVAANALKAIDPVAAKAGVQ